jgi:hypothetical protein
MRLRLHAAALALASDGSLLVNLAHLHNTQDPAGLLRVAVGHGGALFLGVTLTRRESRDVARWVEDSTAEATAHLGGRRLRRLGRAP